MCVPSNCQLTVTPIHASQSRSLFAIVETSRQNFFRLYKNVKTTRVFQEIPEPGRNFFQL